MGTELLKKVYLFRSLGMNELIEVLKICRQQKFAKGAVIFEDGAPGDNCYIIETGAVRISKMIPNAGEEALAVLRDGDYFGEMALIDGSTRSAAAIAHEDTLCLVVRKEDLDRLMTEDRDIGYKLLRTFCETLSKRLRDMNNKMTQFLAMTATFGGGGF